MKVRYACRYRVDDDEDDGSSSLLVPPNFWRSCGRSGTNCCKKAAKVVGRSTNRARLPLLDDDDDVDDGDARPSMILNSIPGNSLQVPLLSTK